MQTTLSIAGLRGLARQPRARGTVAGSVLAAALLLLVGCGTTASRGDNGWLDSETGLTVTIAERVMVFARTEAQYSLSARDYVYLGPVETNRQGLREHYMWVGVATTLDRGFLAPQSDPPVALVATVLDEPIEFGLEPWSDLVPGSSSLQAYATKVALESELGARVTLDQLRMLNEARPEEIRLVYASSRSRIYSAWEAGAGWPELASESD